MFIYSPWNWYGLLTITWHCNWPQFNWVKETDNTASLRSGLTVCFYRGCAGFGEIWQIYFEFQILWNLSLVDFHTLTLQLPIQTENYVAPERQVFVNSLEISKNRAHPRGMLILLEFQVNSQKPYRHQNSEFKIDTDILQMTLKFSLFTGDFPK